MSEITFRDFAGAVMQQDRIAAARVLAELLALDDATASAAAGHFFARMSSDGQGFMMKAMGLRTAVAQGSDQEIAALVADCFGLDDQGAAAATAVLKQRYA
jgi:hypothetical protein